MIYSTCQTKAFAYFESFQLCWLMSYLHHHSHRQNWVVWLQARILCLIFRSNHIQLPRLYPHQPPRGKRPCQHQTWCTAIALWSPKGVAVRFEGSLIVHAPIRIWTPRPGFPFRGLFIRGTIGKRLPWETLPRPLYQESLKTFPSTLFLVLLLCLPCNPTGKKEEAFWLGVPRQQDKHLYWSTRLWLSAIPWGDRGPVGKLALFPV